MTHMSTDLSTPGRALLNVGSLLAIFSIVVACTGSASSDTTASTTTLFEPATPSEALEFAESQLITAGSYAFEVRIELKVKSETVEIAIEGWVDGADRLVQVRRNGSETITRVTGGIATIEEDDQVSGILMAEAESAPSLDILGEVEDAVFSPETGITGRLKAPALRSLDLDLSGNGTVIVELSDSGALAGYLAEGNNGQWTVVARFFDLGETFAG